MPWLSGKKMMICLVFSFQRKPSGFSVKWSTHSNPNKAAQTKTKKKDFKTHSSSRSVRTFVQCSVETTKVEVETKQKTWSWIMIFHQVVLMKSFPLFIWIHFIFFLLLDLNTSTRKHLNHNQQRSPCWSLNRRPLRSRKINAARFIAKNVFVQIVRSFVRMFGGGDELCGSL